MESNKRKLQIRAFEFLDRALSNDMKKSLSSDQMNEILRCIVNWLYVDRDEINLCVLLDITAYITKRKLDAEAKGERVKPVDLSDHPDFLRDLQKL